MTESADWPNLLINSATLIAALSAAYFSHRALAQQSKQRLAEFRKEWIENLRIQLAGFRASSYRRRTAKTNREFYKKSKNNDLTRMWNEKYMEFTEETARSYHYVLLCLNEGEAEHAALMARMKLHLEEKQEELDALTGTNAPEFLTLARAVLKKEWERLKSEFK
jgi:hypothetical protein